MSETAVGRQDKKVVTLEGSHTLVRVQVKNIGDTEIYLGDIQVDISDGTIRLTISPQEQIITIDSNTGDNTVQITTRTRPNPNDTEDQFDP